MPANQAIFLDKDGTLVKDVPYNVDPLRIRLMDGAAEALPALHAAGYQIFIVSNQSGVAHGYFQRSALWAVEKRLREMLADLGVPLRGFYYCPHHPDGQLRPYAVVCECRKPQPGMLLRAAREHRLDLARSWMIGDILDDVEAGRRAGCKSILVDNGNETAWVAGAQREPHHRVKHLAAAAQTILSAPASQQAPKPMLFQREVR